LPSQFNTLVQGLSIDTITPEQILAAGKPIFLDITTSSDINSINTLIQSWSRIHAPTYGQPIPSSEKKGTVVGSGTLVSATTNEVRKVLVVSYTNAGGAPITVDLTLWSVVIESQVTIQSLETKIAVLPELVLCSDSINLDVAVTAGNDGDLTTTAISMGLIQ
jgi:hypothetical protein